MHMQKFPFRNKERYYFNDFLSCFFYNLWKTFSSIQYFFIQRKYFILYKIYVSDGNNYKFIHTFIISICFNYSYKTKRFYVLQIALSYISEYSSHLIHKIAPKRNKMWNKFLVPKNILRLFFIILILFIFKLVIYFITFKRTTIENILNVNVSKQNPIKKISDATTCLLI